jgi:hypothetical protein
MKLDTDISPNDCVFNVSAHDIRVAEAPTIGGFYSALTREFDAMMENPTFRTLYEAAQTVADQQALLRLGRALLRKS